MAQYITWTQCYYSVSHAHFSTAYANFNLLIASLIFFGLFYAFPFVYERMLKDKLSEERAEGIAKGLILAGVFCLIAYIIWFAVFFRPDAIQTQIGSIQSQMSGLENVEALVGMI